MEKKLNIFENGKVICSINFNEDGDRDHFESIMKNLFAIANFNGHSYQYTIE